MWSELSNINQFKIFFILKEEKFKYFLTARISYLAHSFTSAGLLLLIDVHVFDWHFTPYSRIFDVYYCAQPSCGMILGLGSFQCYCFSHRNGGSNRNRLSYWSIAVHNVPTSMQNERSKKGIFLRAMLDGH